MSRDYDIEVDYDTATVAEIDTKVNIGKVERGYKTEEAKSKKQKVSIEGSEVIEVIEMEPKAKTDCMLLTKDKKYAFRVHSIVLEAMSPVFRDLDFKESVVCDATRFELFGFICAMYRHPNGKHTVEEWIQIFSLCAKYEVKLREGIFFKFLCNPKISWKEILLILEFSHSHNLMDVYQQCLQRILPLTKIKDEHFTCELSKLPPRILADLLVLSLK